MHIYFAGDHAGFEMKGKLMEFVRSLGHEVEDLGPFSYSADDDFPDFVIPLARKVASYSPFLKGSTPEGGGISEKSPQGSPLYERGNSSASADLGTSFTKGGIEEVRGIICAASGQGEAMCANRFKGVRATVYYGPASKSQTDASGKVFDLLTSTRQHNNANVLSLGARFLSEEEAKAAVQLWLETPFSNEERHVRRIKKID